MPFLKYKNAYSAAMATYYVTKMILPCSPLIGQFFDTMIVALIDKEWYWIVLETVLSHLEMTCIHALEITSTDEYAGIITCVFNIHMQHLISQRFLRICD